MWKRITYALFLYFLCIVLAGLAVQAKNNNDVKFWMQLHDDTPPATPDYQANVATAGALMEIGLVGVAISGMLWWVVIGRKKTAAVPKIAIDGNRSLVDVSQKR